MHPLLFKLNAEQRRYIHLQFFLPLVEQIKKDPNGKGKQVLVPFDTSSSTRLNIVGPNKEKKRGFREIPSKNRLSMLLYVGLKKKKKKKEKATARAWLKESSPPLLRTQSKRGRDR